VIFWENICDVDQYIYIDEVHVSQNGNKIIAQKIYEYISSNDSNQGEGG
jgi:hypothetical protein